MSFSLLITWQGQRSGKRVLLSSSTPAVKEKTGEVGEIKKNGLETILQKNEITDNKGEKREKDWMGLP